jgi:hypothetical protein
MLAAFLIMGNIFLHNGKPFGFIEEKRVGQPKKLESRDD